MVETVINGTALGAIYALVALGFVIVYKTTNVLNFAHGSLGAAGGLIMASLVTDGGFGIESLAGLNPLIEHADHLWGWGANLVLAMVLAAGLGLVVERLVVRPMLGQSQFAVTVVTIGVSITLQVFVDRAPIARTLRVPWGAESWTVGEFTVVKSSVASLVLAGMCFAGLLVFNRSRLGLAARAVASDQEAALVQGMNVGVVTAIAWALAAAMATVAAVAFSFSPRGTGVIVTAATPGLFFRALAVMALGGWDSYRGALIGGLSIGLLQVGLGRFLSGHVHTLGAGFPVVVPYLLMIVVLLVRPAGLFGQPVVRRV